MVDGTLDSVSTTPYPLLRRGGELFSWQRGISLCLQGRGVEGRRVLSFSTFDSRLFDFSQ